MINLMNLILILSSSRKYLYNALMFINLYYICGFNYKPNLDIKINILQHKKVRACLLTPNFPWGENTAGYVFPSLRVRFNGLAFPTRPGK